MKLYLGTNYGHGSSAAVMSEDGNLLFAIEEGRLIGDKETSRFPFESLKEIRKFTDGEFDGWAEGWHLYNRLFYKGFLQTLKYGYKNSIYIQHRLIKEISRYFTGRSYYKEILRDINLKRTNLVGHHLAHSYSLLPWGLPPKSLIIVSDTTAEKESISSFYWSGIEMKRLCHSNFPHSIGSVYHQLAYHLGFKGRTGPGKVMALSALGNPIWYSKMREISRVKNGQFAIDLKKYPAWRINNTWLHYASIQNDIGFKNEILSAHQNFENGKDLAASAQKWFTELTYEYIIQSIDIAINRFGFEVNNIGISGGAALNCQANGEIIRRLNTNYGIKEVIVSPWSDDSGTAIGAAAWMLKKSNPNVQFTPTNAFLGLPVSTKYNIKSDDIEKAVDALVDGEIVALISRRLEFGPRALGGRCLLADARNINMQVRLNNIKNRPYFMPFAPAILKEDFGVFFQGIGSENMAWTVKAKPKAIKYTPAAIHKTGEARVQVVADESLLLHKILSAYKERIGFGLLLLTSLNGKGEAIPASIEQSICTAKKLNVDAIITDNKFLCSNKHFERKEYESI